MAEYCINKNAQSGGEYEIHNLDNHCTRLPNKENRISLGSHSSDEKARAKAKYLFPNWDIDGCYYCCESIHKK